MSVHRIKQQDKVVDAEQDANASAFNLMQTIDTLRIAAVP